jgi:hypothetical protein
MKILVSSLVQQSASPHGEYLPLLRITSKPLSLSMILMSYDDSNKFMFVCIVIASRIHKFSNGDVKASA